MVMSVCAFSSAGSSSSPTLAWAAMAALRISSPRALSLRRSSTTPSSAVSSELIAAFRLLSLSIAAPSDWNPAMASSRLAILSCRRLQRRQLARALRLVLHRKHRRRTGRQRLRIGLQPECCDDLGNIASRHAVEEIADLREHQPAGGAGDDGGARYGRKGQEQLGPDAELTPRFFRVCFFRRHLRRRLKRCHCISPEIDGVSVQLDHA